MVQSWFRYELSKKKIKLMWGRSELNRRPTGFFAAPNLHHLLVSSLDYPSGALSGELRSHCRPTRLGYDPTN